MEEGGQVEMVDGADDSNWCVEARRALELEQKFERVCKRYEAYGWHTQTVNNGDDADLSCHVTLGLDT